MLDPSLPIIAIREVDGTKYKARLLDYDFREDNPEARKFTWVVKVESRNQQGVRDDCLLLVNPENGEANEASGWEAYTVENVVKGDASVPSYC